MYAKANNLIWTFSFNKIKDFFDHSTNFFVPSTILGAKFIMSQSSGFFHSFVFFKKSSPSKSVSLI